MRIIEYIGNGVRTSELTRHRLANPEPGDVVYFRDGKRGIVERVHSEEQAVTLGQNVCSAFLGWLSEERRPYVSINGGPIDWYALRSLEPLYRVEPVQFWNWADGTPKAEGGAYFSIVRPAFRLLGGSSKVQPPEVAERTFGMRVESATKSGDVVEGIPFEWHLAGPQGARFYLLVSEGITPEQIQRAKAKLAADRDVVGVISILKPNG